MYGHAVMDDGLTKMQRYRLRHPERALESARLSKHNRSEEQRERDRERNRISVAAYAARNQEKIRAKGILNRAVKRGDLTREPCVECGDPDTHGHHTDYSRPLDVVWLCPLHHGRTHAGLL